MDVLGIFCRCFDCLFFWLTFASSSHAKHRLLTKSITAHIHRNYRGVLFYPRFIFFTPIFPLRTMSILSLGVKHALNCLKIFEKIAVFDQLLKNTPHFERKL